MIHTSRQLKDLIRNLSNTTGIEAHVLIRRYMMERLLERISLSPYKESFILKGGMLVSALVGIDTRSTMDMDTTVKGLPVNAAVMEQVITEIISINLDDNIAFHIKSCSVIMEDMDYSGLRISLEAMLDNSVTPLKLDISTGDAITPREMQYQYRLMFEDRSISLMAYPLETVLAEKLETILSRSTLNSRMRDFYDIRILQDSFSDEINSLTLAKAFAATAANRGSDAQAQDVEDILHALESSIELRQQWKIYTRRSKYAEPYSWEDIVQSVRELAISAGLFVNNQ